MLIMIHVVKKWNMKYKSFVIFSKKFLKKLQQLSTSKNVKLDELKERLKKK